MKKLLSVFVMLSIFATLFGGTAVFAVAANPVFDLQFDADTNAVSDAAGTAQITAGGVTVVEEEMRNGRLQYLTLKDGLNLKAEAAENAEQAFLNLDATTIESWVFIEQPVNAYPRLFAVSDANNAAGFETMFTPDGNLYVRPNKGGEAVHSINGAFGKWSHFVITRQWNEDSTCTYETYVNGEKISGLSGTTDVLTRDIESSLVLGRSLDGFAMQGKLSTFRIYESVFGAADIAGIYQETKDAYLPPVTPVVLDMSFQNQMVIDKQNGTSIGPANVSYGIDRAIEGELPYVYFNGTPGSVLYTGNGAGGNAFNNLEASTIELWLKIEDDFVDPNRYVRLFSTKEGTLDVLVYPGGALNYRPDGTDIGKSCDIRDYIGKWTHFAFTKQLQTDGALAYTAYINGVKIDSLCGSITNPQTRNETQLFVGADTGGGNCLKGKLSMFRAYNIAFDQTKAEARYNETCGDYALSTKAFGVASISCAGPDIDRYAGGISLQFDNKVDPATVNEATISFVKEDGTLLADGAHRSISADGKVVHVTFGTLDAGEEYRLFLTSGVKSIYGTPAEPTEYRYTASASVGYENDFQGGDFVVDGTAPDVGLRYISDGVDGCADNIIVKQTESGKKYLNVKSTALNQNSGIYLPFTPNVSADSLLVIEYRARPSTTQVNPTSFAARDIGRLGYAAANNYMSVAAGVGDQIYAEGTGTSFSADSKDADGFYHIRVIVQKDENGKYGTWLYNGNDATQAPVYKQSTTDAIGFFSFANIYPYNSENDLNDSIDLASVRVYSTAAPNLLYAADAGEGQYRLFLNSAIDEETLPTFLTLINPTDESEYMGSVTYDAAAKALIFEPYSDFDIHAAYTVDLSEMTNEAGVSFPSQAAVFFETERDGFLAANVVFRNQSDQPLRYGIAADTTAVSVSFTAYDTQQNDCQAILAVYQDGRLVKVSYQPFSTNAAAPASVTLSPVTFAAGQGQYARLLLWKAGESLKPLKNRLDLPFDSQ